jgi:TPR repeat protein
MRFFVSLLFLVALLSVSGCGSEPESPESVFEATLEEANAGTAIAQFNLGFMYYLGEGVPQDYKESAKWYRKAAEQGIAMAQVYLGVMYYLGKGVPQDYKEAAKWYRKAAEQGESNAQNFLGKVYYVGKGVPQDYKESAKWYRKAAEQGDAKAQFYLGLCYATGQGVPEDDKEAYIWLSIASVGPPMRGMEKAKEVTQKFKNKLSPERLAEAQEQATARFKQIEERQQ